MCCPTELSSTTKMPLQDRLYQVGLNSQLTCDRWKGIEISIPFLFVKSCEKPIKYNINRDILLKYSQNTPPRSIYTHGIISVFWLSISPKHKTDANP